MATESETKEKPVPRREKAVRPPEKAAEKQRLADALRENLKRRKAQGRARRAGQAPDKTP